MKIIYPYDNRVALVMPNPKSSKTLDEIAKNSVPKGLPYKIVDDKVVPNDPFFFEAWEADFSNPDGYGEQIQKPNMLGNR